MPTAGVALHVRDGLTQDGIDVQAERNVLVVLTRLRLRRHLALRLQVRRHVIQFDAAVTGMMRIISVV